MKRVQLKSKEASKLLQEYNITLSKKDQCVLADDKFLLINNIPSFFYHEGKLLPTLKYLQKELILKVIVVDTGAIRFITKGADIMRPGITEIDEDIEKSEAIVVIEETHRKPLAVGITLFSGKEMKAASLGKVIQNIHYVGDDLWKM